MTAARRASGVRCYVIDRFERRHSFRTGSYRTNQVEDLVNSEECGFHDSLHISIAMSLSLRGLAGSMTANAKRYQ